MVGEEGNPPQNAFNSGLGIIVELIIASCPENYGDWFSHKFDLTSWKSK